MPGQKGKEKDGAQNNFLFPQDKVNFEMHLRVDRGMYFFLKLKKEKNCLSTETQVTCAVAYTDKNNNV